MRNHRLLLLVGGMVAVLWVLVGGMAIAPRAGASRTGGALLLAFMPPLPHGHHRRSLPTL